MPEPKQINLKTSEQLNAALQAKADKLGKKRASWIKEVLSIAVQPSIQIESTEKKLKAIQQLSERSAMDLETYIKQLIDDAIDSQLTYSVAYIRSDQPSQNVAEPLGKYQAKKKR